MNIVLLQAANGDVEGPTCRVPFGNYKIEKNGRFSDCYMIVNSLNELPLNSKVILSNNSSIKVLAKDAIELTVRFIREN